MTDFGTSKGLSSDDENRTSTGFMGTLNYMAPEIAKKRVVKKSFNYDPFAADMWSLGVTFYHALTNWLPFEADNFK